MPTNDVDQTLPTIETADLEAVAGGSRHSGNSEVTAALTAIQGSLKDLAGSKNNQSDPMQMILMMMMMGGFGGGGGGGGGGVVAAPATAPVINIDTSIAGGGGFRRRGKKGW